MKALVLGCGGVILMGFIGCLVLTNPGQSDYEEYASDQLVYYVKDRVCYDRGVAVLLQRYCQTLVDSSRKQLGHFLSQKTERNNYLFFSIYKTDLFVPGLFPRYQFETIGILENFYTYESDQI